MRKTVAPYNGYVHDLSSTVLAGQSHTADTIYSSVHAIYVEIRVQLFWSIKGSITECFS